MWLYACSSLRVLGLIRNGLGFLHVLTRVVCNAPSIGSLQAICCSLEANLVYDGQLHELSVRDTNSRCEPLLIRLGAVLKDSIVSSSRVIMTPQRSQITGLATKWTSSQCNAHFYDTEQDFYFPGEP